MFKSAVEARSLIVAEALSPGTEILAPTAGMVCGVSPVILLGTETATLSAGGCGTVTGLTGTTLERDTPPTVPIE